MPASKSNLSEWFVEGLQKGATHMIVKCDFFEFRGAPGDNCCYPIFVMPDEDVRTRARGGDRLMEVYSLRRDMSEQINTSRRVFNYDA